MTRGKIGLPCALWIAIPGATDLTVIAAENPITHQRSDLDRYRIFVLDGEIGNATPSVENVWFGEGVCGAHLDASTALAAAIGLFAVVDGQA